MRLQNILIPILLIILAIASFFYYTKPAYDDTASIKANIDEYETALSQVRETQEIRDDLLSRFNQVSDDEQDLMSRILPEKLDRVLFLIELDRIAAQNGLTVQSVSVGGSGDDSGEGAPAPVNNTAGEGSAEGIRSASVSFSTTAGYADAQAFIRSIERSARIIDITNLSISSPGTEGGGEEGAEATAVGVTDGQNTYSISGKTYWMPPQSEN